MKLTCSPFPCFRALHKASRALDIRVYALRNRTEDQAVMLKWIGSLSMAADLGTKILPASLAVLEYSSTVLL